MIVFTLIKPESLELKTVITINIWWIPQRLVSNEDYTKCLVIYMF